MVNKIYNLAIIGGGAAGLAAAAAVRFQDCILFEAEDRAGKKILATGGGKCNLLNQNLSAEMYNAPDFVQKTFVVTDKTQILSFFKGLGLEIRTDTEGRVYPFSESAATVLDVLRAYSNAEIKTDESVAEIKKDKDLYKLKTAKGEYVARNVLLCAGSPASAKKYCQIKGTDKLFKFKPFVPSLTALETETNPIRALNGVRAKGEFTIDIDHSRHTEKGEIIFKKTGISGIAIMNLSAYLARADNLEKALKSAFISLNFLECGCLEAQEWLAKRAELMHAKTVPDLLRGLFGRVLSQAVIEYARLKPTDIADRDNIIKLAHAATDFKLKVLGLSGLEHAQAASGGVELAQIDALTMQSTAHKGLYFAGEAVGVDGLCGGYNLAWAWSSALSAIKSISKQFE